MTDRPAIKPLEWAEQLGISYAETPFGVYKVADHGAWWFDDGPIKGNLGRQQAQSDFEARIRSCLLDKPEAGEGCCGKPVDMGCPEGGSAWVCCREAYPKRAASSPLSPLSAGDAGEIERLRAALEWMRDRDDRNGSLPEAYRQKIDAALSTPADTDAAQCARRKAFEEAAELIEANIVKDSSAGKFLAPRQEGNRDGLHYAAAIRQLAEEEAL